MIMKFSFVLSVVAYYLCVVEGERCTTPAGGPGECIKINECDTILELLRKIRSRKGTQEDFTRMEKSQCGTKTWPPTVCCPSDTDDRLNPGDSTDNEEETCFTPDAQEGKCVNLNNCQHIKTLLSHPNDEINAFVQNSKCGSDASNVCCGSQPPSFGPSRSGVCSSTVAPPYPGSRCCGVESSSERIVGGKDAELDQFPWMALLEYSKDNKIELMCGGILISGRYVLTAAHCVFGEVPINVRLGEYNTSNNPVEKDCKLVAGGDEDCNTGAVVIKIEKIIPHEHYNQQNVLLGNDIALLKLKDMAPYTDFIRPICLPKTDITESSIPNIRFRVSGWGYVDKNNTSPTKQYVNIPYMKKDICQRSLNVGRRVNLRTSQICAGGEANKDACAGDSGGPLMYCRGVTSEVVGVVSFGMYPCGEEGVPGVYTKVYEHLPWIRKNIKP